MCGYFNRLAGPFSARRGLSVTEQSGFRTIDTALTAASERARNINALAATHQTNPRNNCMGCRLREPSYSLQRGGGVLVS